MNKCKCEWCNRTPDRSGKGYCRFHYDQIRKYGYILDIRTRRDNNRIIILDDYAEIIITDGKDQEICRAKVSLDIVDKIKSHRWTLNDNGYVRTYNNNSPVYLHRMIVECPEGLEVDHINRDKLDNRNENLRIVSHSINRANNGGKNVRMITNRRLSKPYYAAVTKNNKHIFSRYFETEEEALREVENFKRKNAQLDSPYPQNV